MKKSHLFLIFLLILVFLAGCSVEDGMRGRRFQVIEKVKLAPGDQYTMDGVHTLADAIVVQRPGKKGSGKGLSLGDESFFSTNDGSLMPFPDGEGVISFSGEELGLSNEEEILVGQFVNKNDLKITKEELVRWSINKFYDEYYYVDFSDPEWADLDTSKIVVDVTSKECACGVSLLLDRKTLTNPTEVYDFSDLEGLGLYLYAIADPNGSRDFPSVKVHVTTPVELEVGQSISLTKDYATLHVPAVNDGKEYMLVVNGMTSYGVRAMAENSHLGFFLGTNDSDSRPREGGIVPFYYPEKKQMVLYLGEIEEAFRMGLNLDEEYTRFKGADITLVEADGRVIPRSEWHLLDDIYDAPLELKALYPASEYLTIPMKASDEVLVVFESVTGVQSSWGFQYDPNGYGSLHVYGSSRQHFDFRKNSAGYLVLALNETVRKGTTFLTASPYEVNEIPKGHTYQYDASSHTYRCIDANCSVSIQESTLFGKGSERFFRSGDFTTTSVFPEVGEIRIISGGHLEPNGSINVTGGGQGNQNSRGIPDLWFTYEGNKVSFEIEGFTYRTDEKSLKGSVVIGRTRYSNVVFTCQD